MGADAVSLHEPRWSKVTNAWGAKPGRTGLAPHLHSRLRRIPRSVARQVDRSRRQWSADEPLLSDLRAGCRGSVSVFTTIPTGQPPIPTPWHTRRAMQVERSCSFGEGRTQTRPWRGPLGTIVPRWVSLVRDTGGLRRSQRLSRSAGARTTAPGTAAARTVSTTHPRGAAPRLD